MILSNNILFLTFTKKLELTMSTNISKQKREDLLYKIEEIRKYLKNNLYDENVRNLMGYLNELTTQINGQKYGLVFEEHREKIDETLENNLPVLTEEKDLFVGNGGEMNFLLEGDNLASLQLLEKTHKGKIDVIYIDPPYNTGNKDFIYDDDFVDTEDTFRHSKWCSFISKRLEIAKNLLSQNGFIAISIDDNEYSAMKILCDEIFGSDNYLSTFHIQVRYAEKSINEEKPFKPLMEYVVFYAKNSLLFSPNRDKVEYGLESFCFKITELNKGERFFVKDQEVIVFKKGDWKIEKIAGNIDGLKETWITGSIYTTMSYGKVFQTVVEPRIEIDGLGCLYKVLGRGEDGLGYRYYTGPAKANATKGKMFSAIPLDKRKIFESGNAPIRELPILTTYDFSPDFGNIRHEGGVPFGSGKKPVKMLKQFINYHKGKDITILDFFAGSGSTGHATLALNSEDGGKRKFILCTNNENGICRDITYQRLKTVITGERKDGSKYSDGLPGSLKYFKVDFVPVAEKEYYEYADKLLLHVRELVELENAVDFEHNNSVAIVLTEDEMTEFEKVISTSSTTTRTLYLGHDVLLSKEQKNLLTENEIEVKIIPQYYYPELNG